jgi:hypothetical protein
MFDFLKFWFSSSTLTQLQTYQPLIYILFVVVNVIFGTINVRKIIYDLNKDKANISIQIRRDSISLPAIQQPSRDYLLIEVVNKGHKPVVINEVGIVFPGKNNINVVDMPWIFPLLKEHIEDIMGSIEWVVIPGTVNPESLAITQILFSNLQEAYKNTKKERQLLIEEPGYLRTLQFFTFYEELMKSYNPDTQVLTVTPYIVTTTGQRVTGKKTNIQLGNLNIAVQTTAQNQRQSISSIIVRNYLKIKVPTIY